MDTTQLTAPQFGMDVTDFIKDLASDLEDESRDQIGTFLLALFVGALATICRISVQRKHRWWLNMIMVHGAIFLYWWNQCHLAEPASPWFTTAHGALCWRDNQGNFQRLLWWGGDSERFWVNVLVWLAICVNVVPAYATGNEASRHMTHVKKRACNPLINHIIAGILCVIFPFFVVTYRVNILIPAAVLLDIYHQITIHRLIANHDGIWVLRAVSMSLAICKWIAILNLYSSEPLEMLDQMFIMSTGFLGTRAYAATAYICYYLGMGDIKTAEWYSIGLMTADFMIMGRLWGQMRIGFWLTIVNCAAMHYHQMWKKWLHLRPHFVGVCCVLTMTVAHSGKFTSLLFTIVFSYGNFILPHFNRYRPRPVKGQICSPAVSTRVEEMFTRSARNLKQFARRLSAFRRSDGLTNSLLSVRSAVETPRSALMTPRATPTPRATRKVTRKATPRFQRKISETPVANIPEGIPEGVEEDELESLPLVRARPSVALDHDANPKATESRRSLQAPPADAFESSVVVNERRPGLQNMNSAGTSTSSLDTTLLEASDVDLPIRGPSPESLLVSTKKAKPEVHFEDLIQPTLPKSPTSA